MVSSVLFAFLILDIYQISGRVKQKAAVPAFKQPAALNGRFGFQPEVNPIKTSRSQPIPVARSQKVSREESQLHGPDPAPQRQSLSQKVPSEESSSDSEHDPDTQPRSWSDDPEPPHEDEVEVRFFSQQVDKDMDENGDDEHNEDTHEDERDLDLDGHANTAADWGTDDNDVDMEADDEDLYGDYVPSAGLGIDIGMENNDPPAAPRVDSKKVRFDDKVNAWSLL